MEKRDVINIMNGLHKDGAGYLIALAVFGEEGVTEREAELLTRFKLAEYRTGVPADKREEVQRKITGCRLRAMTSLDTCDEGNMGDGLQEAQLELQKAVEMCNDLEKLVLRINSKGLEFLEAVLTVARERAAKEAY